jgi:hypothetical protein
VETTNTDYNIIRQYLEGSLDQKSMHELEKEALKDPFLADALEGYALAKQPAGQQLSLLQTQLQERIAQQQENKNVFNYSWQRLSVAATAGLLFLTACILLWIKIDKAQEYSNSRPKQVDVTLTDKKYIPAPTSGTAKPAIGWKDYNRYLVKSVGSYGTKVTPGKVTVSFQVGDDNMLRAFNIVKGIDPATDAEAIRVVKDGPKWRHGENARTTVTVWFKN